MERNLDGREEGEGARPAGGSACDPAEMARPGATRERWGRVNGAAHNPVGRVRVRVRRECDGCIPGGKWRCPIPFRAAHTVQ
jgi:hypothetical protein